MKTTSTLTLTIPTIEPASPALKRYLGTVMQLLRYEFETDSVLTECITIEEVTCPEVPDPVVRETTDVITPSVVVDDEPFAKPDTLGPLEQDDNNNIIIPKGYKRIDKGKAVYWSCYSRSATVPGPIGEWVLESDYADDVENQKLPTIIFIAHDKPEPETIYNYNSSNKPSQTSS